MAAGDITDALVSELGYRLRDPEKTKFTDATKLTFLNRAQLRVANMLRDEYLGELETSQYLVVGDGVSTWAQNNDFVTILLDLATPLRGGSGLYMAEIGNTTVGAVETVAYGKKIDISAVKRLENSYLGTQSNRLWFVYDNKVWIYGTMYAIGTTAGISSITYHYLDAPATMTTSVDPELNTQFHGLMLDFAEADCLALDNNWAGRSVAINRALTEIQRLNERYINPEGIGVKGGK